MLLTLKINNCLIYNQEVEFSMHANMHYRRFPGNVALLKNVHVLKSAILIGPNNAGKTCFVKTILLIKKMMLNQNPDLVKNLFTESQIIELEISFLENGKEYLFAIKYDNSRNEYIYERFCEIKRNKKHYIHFMEYYIRDSRTGVYNAKDEGLESVMQIMGRNNILIYLLDVSSFPYLGKAREAIRLFASRIDILDMNNIPIQKTIDMLKQSEEMHQRIAKFIRNADLSLDDFRYLNDEEIKIGIEKINAKETNPQENALTLAAPVAEMLHLASFYHGVPLPSILYDSTGTKKMAAIASYVIDALEHGRILVVDELDNSLHFRLTRAILALFNNELNQTAQLIATVHDISLLDCQKLFRKEQIWFAHKDQKNAYLYSLSEFTAEKDGVRDTSDLIQKYRRGVFGALPEPDLFETILEGVE